MKILLVQIGSMGDCLFVTTIAKQIKEIDFPGCQLSWLIGDKYKQVIYNNIYIDEILEVPIKSIYDRSKVNKFISTILKNGRIFDKIIITDAVSKNLKYFFGPTRSCFFRSYGGEITVSKEPIIFLTSEETSNVAAFARKHDLLNENNYTILFEYSPQSGQSNMNIEKALNISNAIIKNNINVKFILTSNNKIKNENDNIIDGSVLSWRENAEITKYCKLLVGCSSGITWLNTSNWSAKIPMIQIIKKSQMYAKGVYSSSVALDFSYFGLSTNNLIELYDAEDDVIIDCISLVVNESFQKAKLKYPISIIQSKEKILESSAIRINELLIELQNNNKKILKLVKSLIVLIVKKILPGYK